MQPHRTTCLLIACFWLSACAQLKPYPFKEDCFSWTSFNYYECEVTEEEKEKIRNEQLEFGPCTEGDLINRTCK